MGEKFRRVTIIDSHAMFAELLAQSLDRRGYRCRVVIARPGTSPTSLLRTILATSPELVVVGIDRWSGHEEQAAVHLSLARSGQRILVVMETDGAIRRGEAFFGGASAVACKSMPVNEFLGLARRTMQGVPAISRLERLRVVDLYRQQQHGRDAARGRLASLSAQERIILRHLMAGRAVREIAVLRVVSEQTVRTQVKSVLGKLDVSSQCKAVAVAWDNGWEPAAA
ncbi:LuxR C-terminal-related transcriptional regulator [Nocardioides sp. SR21]|uniref:LuxR C-terminal-related transcriptional regulator n=1 Tax=Nocardioides sp. SR21 TaxID=2919501 RepID=UPI001FAADCE5|nr:LuxR C-terminal-related transcriptional regulator [Nocardioides sp. SR21]